MNCPVCNRSLAPTLSICFTCGAMVNDSVREELQTEIGVSRKLPKSPSPRAVVETVRAPISEAPVAPTMVEAPAPKVAADAPAPKASAKPTQTVELNVQKTSPTLVGFQAKNPTIPDWRLQVQNAVRTRKGSDPSVDAVGRSYEKQLVTRGANALKPEYLESPKPEVKPQHKDPRLAAALNRISESRSTYMKEPQAATPLPPRAPNKSFP